VSSSAGAQPTVGSAVRHSYRATGRSRQWAGGRMVGRAHSKPWQPAPPARRTGRRQDL